MNAEKRKEKRKKTYAKVLLTDKNIPGYLRDLSKEGCHLSLLNPVSVKKGENFEVTVIPGEEIGIANFSILLEVLWTHSDSVYFSIGGKITPISDGENMERFNKLSDYYGK